MRRGSAGVGTTVSGEIVEINSNAPFTTEHLFETDHINNHDVLINGSLTVGAQTMLKGATVIATPEAIPESSDLENQSISFYLDEPNNQLKVRVKYSDGLLKTGTIALS